MFWRSLAIVAAIVFVPSPGWADPDARVPLQRHRRFYGRPYVFRPPVGPIPRAPRLLFEPPGRFMPPRIGRPSPLDGDQIPSPVPLAQGFHITVAMSGVLQAPPILNRAFEVGKALGACWTPPSDLKWKIITIRLSFKRDGSVNGEPRVPFTDAGSAQRNSDLAKSLLAALKDCAPLPFSPSLGSAIAGEMFAISFTHQDQR